MSVLFTSPYNMGDNFILIPIAYQYAKQHNTKIDICVNEYNKNILSLLNSQSWVNKAYADNRVNGVQVDHAWRKETPPNKLEDINYFTDQCDTVYNLGYKEPPFNKSNLTLASVYDIPIDTTNLLTESCIEGAIYPPKNLAVIAEGTRDKCNDAVIETLYPIIDNVKHKFKDILIPTIRSTKEVEEYYERIPYTKIENNNCDYLKLSNIMRDSIVVTSYSSPACLAYAMKVPLISIIGYEWQILDHWKPGNKHYKHCYILEAEDSEGLQNAIEEIMNDTNIAN